MNFVENAEALVPILGRLQSGSRIAVLTGAGMSAESGLKTFRDSGGLWEQYSIYEVATPEAWQRDPHLVQRFYNERRKQLLDAEPNEAHHALAELEAQFQVDVVTQNVDDLHERAGSSRVLHLHGELRKCRSSVNENLIYEVDGWEVKMGDTCEEGSQLRPHVVWFGEAVPNIEPAAELISEADLLLVIGTSLEVYPAAGLVHAARRGVPVLVIDPAEISIPPASDIWHLRQNAGTGVRELAGILLDRS